MRLHHPHGSFFHRQPPGELAAGDVDLLLLPLHLLDEPRFDVIQGEGIRQVGQHRIFLETDLRRGDIGENFVANHGQTGTETAMRLARGALEGCLPDLLGAMFKQGADPLR